MSNPVRRVQQWVAVRIKRFLKRYLIKALREEDSEGLFVHSANYSIESDLYYTRPLMIPFSVQQAGAEQLNKYITEATKYYRGQFDDPYRTSMDLPVSMPIEDPLEEWDYSTRRNVLTNCHAAYHRNPVAKRAVDVTQQFAVGKGHTVTAQNAKVQAVIDDFRANPDNAIQHYERTLLRDLQIDGELIIRYFQQAGQTVIVPLPPWHITEIETEAGFFRRATRFHLEYGAFNVNAVSQMGHKVVDEWIPADQLLHVPINNHSYELRGRPDLYVILPWLKAYKDWLEDRVRQNKWRGALLWWVKIAGAAAGTVAAKVQQWKRPPTPGSAYVSSDKEEVTALTNSVGAPDVSEDGRQIRMMCATGIGLAEYFLGDGENANLATATAQQLPALWKFTDAQEIMREQVWTPIYKRVLQNAIDAGELPAEVRVEDSDGDPVMLVSEDGSESEQFMPALDAFEVAYYELQADDPKTMAEAISLDITNELVSKETARGQRGYDHAMEQKRLQKEKAEHRDDVAQGLDMEVPPPLPGQDQQAGQDSEDTARNGQPDETPAAAER